jgi:hypothetical protein
MAGGLANYHCHHYYHYYMQQRATRGDRWGSKSDDKSEVRVKRQWLLFNGAEPDWYL